MPLLTRPATQPLLIALFLWDKIFRMSKSAMEDRAHLFFGGGCLCVIFMLFQYVA